MILYHILWILAILVLVIFQITWPGTLKIEGTVPNLPLIAIIYIALHYGEERAMIASIFAGLYLDVAANSSLGLHILCLVVPGFIFGRISARLISLHPAIKATLVFLATIMYGIIFNVISYFQNPYTNFLFTLIADTIPQAFYTAILTPIVFWLVGGFFNLTDSLFNYQISE